MQTAAHDVRDHRTDGRGAGQAGRLDGRAVHKAGRDLADEEVVPRLVGAQTREARDGLAQRNVLDREAGFFPHLVQARRRRGRGLLVVHVDGRRPDQQIAVHRGRYQHALAVFARQLEYRVPHMLPRRVVKQEIISPPGRDGHGVRLVGHIVQRVGVYARRIDDAACFQRAVVGLDGPPGSAAVQRVQARNFGVKPKLHTVFGGVLRQRKRQAERADDAARGRPQCGDGSVRDVRLHSHQLVPFYDAQPLHAVGDAVFIELLQRGAVLVAQADDKAAAPVVGKIQFLRKGRHPAAALDVELGHQAAVGRVVPGVDNGAVGLGRAAADVLLLLYYKNFRVIPRKLPRTGAPGHARADNDDVVHIDTSCCWFAEHVRCRKPSGPMRASTSTA